MKNLIKYVVILSCIISSLFITSCKKDDVDNTKPVITVSEPAEHDTLFAGSDVHFECEFLDDVQLKSYKIEIHNNFDGHSHNPKSGTQNEQAWTYTKTWDFEQGKKNVHVHHHEIEIPETIGNEPVANGNYHFGIYCTDVAGNENSVFVDVFIKDGHGHTH